MIRRPPTRQKKYGKIIPAGEKLPASRGESTNNHSIEQVRNGRRHFTKPVTVCDMHPRRGGRARLRAACPPAGAVRNDPGRDSVIHPIKKVGTQCCKRARRIESPQKIPPLQASKRPPSVPATVTPVRPQDFPQVSLPRPRPSWSDTPRWPPQWDPARMRRDSSPFPAQTHRPPWSPPR